MAVLATNIWGQPCGSSQTITQAKSALKQLLIDQLPLKLQRADLDIGDGILTPPPYVVYTTEKWELAGFPAIEITVLSSRPTVDSHAQVMEHRVAIAATLTGDDEEVLTSQVERYVWAIRQVCRDTLLTPEVLTGPIDTGPETFTPLDNAKGLERSWVKGAWIECLITTVGE